MASTYLSKTFGQAGNRRTFTISYWIKMGQVSTGADQAIMGAAQDGSNSDDLYIHTGRLNFSGYYGSTAYQVRTTAKYRDLSGWYHHVIRFDSTQSTASDRLRLYVNGELQTALDNNTYPSQDLETTYFNTARLHTIGSIAHSTPNLPFNGSMSHFHFCDGYSYGADSFGETDSTTGEWKIKTSPSVSYGTNGFFILKDGNSVTDQSGQGNNWTVGGGTLTKTEDCPSNVFCTANPLDYNSVSHSNGNTKLNWSQSAGNFGLTTGTIGMTTGKYYWEAKITSADNSTGIGLGVIQTEPYLSRTTTTGVNTSLFYGLGARFTTAKAIQKTSNGVDSSISDTWSNDVIIRIAYDGDAGKIYMWKGTSEFNGQTFSSNTSFNDATLTAGTMVLPYFTFGDGGSGTKTSQVELNFGNGYFGTTAVSSAGTNASGIGIFEYDVPTGYTALCTKGLNE